MFLISTRTGVHILLSAYLVNNYVGSSPTDASKLAKLAVDSKDKFTVKIGENKDLGQNYSLQAKQVNVECKSGLN